MVTEITERRHDRRTRTRFPINSELRFKLLDDQSVVEMGAGQTINLASGGVAFQTGRSLKPGAFIELSISWPVLLENTLPMRLIAFGRVLRSTPAMTACTIDKYEFRTQSRAAQAATTRRDSMLQRWADEVLKENVKMRLATA